MLFIEYPDRAVYHYCDDTTPEPQPICGSHRNHYADSAPYVVSVRSDGRKLCKPCYQTARFKKILIPPRSAWEHAELNKQIQEAR